MCVRLLSVQVLKTRGMTSKTVTKNTYTSKCNEPPLSRYVFLSNRKSREVPIKVKGEKKITSFAILCIWRREFLLLRTLLCSFESFDAFCTVRLEVGPPSRPPFYTCHVYAGHMGVVNFFLFSPELSLTSTESFSPNIYNL